MNINTMTLQEKTNTYKRLLKKKNLTNPEKNTIRRLKKIIDINKSPIKSSGVFISKDEDSNVRLVDIELSKITMNPYQPRKTYDEEKIKELSESIVAHGLIQPIVVSDNNGVYKLIAGERRYRAYKLANKKTIEAYVHNSLAESQFKRIAISENLQRDDLNCFEEAIAFSDLKKEGLTVRELAKELNKQQTYVQDRLKLSKLSSKAIELAIENKMFTISKLMLIADEEEGIQLKILNKIIKDNLTISQIKALTSKKETQKAIKKKITVIKPYPYKLERIPGVELKANKKKIDISIDTKSFEDKDSSTIKEYIETILKELKA